MPAIRTGTCNGTSRPPSEGSHAVLAWAAADAGKVARYRQMIEVVPGGHAWWTGALSLRGNWRFWLASVDGRDVAIIAHRFDRAQNSSTIATPEPAV
ncbi:MAG: hypothetical protein WKF51_11210 [Geodermatophilaceae bacterium]